MQSNHYVKEFKALAAIAGQLLEQSLNPESNIGKVLLAEDNLEIRWYRAIKEFSGDFRTELPGKAIGENGEALGYIHFGSTNGVLLIRRPISACGFKPIFQQKILAHGLSKSTMITANKSLWAPFWRSSQQLWGGQLHNKSVKPFACSSFGRSTLRACSGTAAPFWPEQALHAERRLPGLGLKIRGIGLWPCSHKNRYPS